MGRRKFILFLILCCFSTALAKLPKLPDTLFGIKVQNLDNEYLRLLFDSNLDNASQRQLSAALSAVQYCLSIDRALDPLDLHTKKTKKLADKHKNTLKSADMRKLFDELRTNIEQKGINVADSELCRLWDFEQILGEINCELRHQTEKGQFKVLLKSGVELERKYKCSELEGQTVPVWANMFKFNLSQKHYDYFESKLALDASSKGKPNEWFGTERIANESELSHRFRMLHNDSDFDRVNAIKTLMERLLLIQHHVGQLMVRHPMTMSAEAMRENEFRALVVEMFQDNVTSSLTGERWIEFFLVFGKVYSFFKQFYDNGNLKNQNETLWVSFVNSFEKLKDDRTMVNELTCEIRPILAEFELDFGSQKMEQNSQCLIKKYGDNLLQFYQENESFRKKFDTNEFGREKLKQFFEMIDRHKRIMAKKLWQLFDETSSTAINDVVNEVFPKKSYLECPNLTEIAQSNSAKISGENADHKLMSAYVELLLQVDGQNGVQVRKNEHKLAMEAALWAYEEMIGTQLLGFADFLWPEEDTNFNNLINDRYKKEWHNVLTNAGEQSADNKLCSLHKFALALAKDERLRKNAHWDWHLKRLVDDTAAPLRLNEPKLILLADELGTSWARVDCMDTQMATKFVQHIKKVPHWTDRVHFYAISALITKLVPFRSVFCYGAQNVPREMIKVKLHWLVQPNAFDAIERSFPEILHFESQLEGTFLGFLLKKLEHKSGTVLAEGYEARLSMPTLMQNIKQFEEYSMPSAEHSLNQQIRQSTQEQIVAIKEQIYESIREENPAEWRKMLCLLMRLNEFLSELFANLNNASLDNMSRWEPACDTEKEVHEAFYQHRQFLNNNHYMALKRVVIAHDERILAIPGAKTKLWKMLKELQPEMKTSAAKVMVWETDEMRRKTRGVFSDNKLLASHYDRLLFAQLSMADQNAQLLLADVLIFVRWMEEKLRLTRRSIATKRTEKNWEKRKEILEAIYDRIWDEEEDTLGQLGAGVAKLFNELKQHMERGATAVLEEDQWVEIMRDYFDPTKGEHQLDPKTRHQYEQWKQSVHRETILALIRDEPAFGDRLKDAHLSNKLNANRVAFILGPENAKAILKRLSDDSLREMAATAPTEIENELKNVFDFSGSNSPTTPRSSANSSIAGEEKAKGKGKKTKMKKISKKSPQNSQKIEIDTNENNKNNMEEAAQKGKGGENVKNKNGGDEMGGKVREKEQNSIRDEMFADIVCNKAYVGLTLSNFEQDNFLATKFEKFVDLVVNESAPADQHLAPNALLIDSLVQLLFFGIYANEISRRLQLIKRLGDVLPQQHIELAELGREWVQLKGAELSKIKSADKLIGQLFSLLKRIVAKMDNFAVEKDGQNAGEFEQHIVANQLKVRHFAKFVVQHAFPWPKIGTEGKIAILSKLLGPTNATAMEKQMVADFETLLRKFKKLDSQRKLDKNVFDKYKEDPHLLQQRHNEGKSRKTKLDFLYQICDGWQEIDFSEKMSKFNMHSPKGIGTNGQMEEKSGRRAEQMQAIIEMKRLFELWSDDARFQLPALFYLKPWNGGDAFKPICLLPDGFDVAGKIFGKFQCNLRKRTLCADNSLFCVFCKNQFVRFLKKNSMGKVPQLETIFMDKNFVVHFVVLPRLEQIPAQNLDGTQIRIFLHHFGNQIRKLLRESYVDEGNYESDEGKREKLRVLLEEELFITDDDGKAARILDKIEKMNNSQKNPTTNEVNVEAHKKKAKMNRQKIEELKEILHVLWNHAMPLSILELLLTREESFGLNHRQDENVMNGGTLAKFRTIYAFVESWAKEKNLFNDHFGHFNSQVLMLMSAKVVLLFPGGTSVPFLLEKFFLIYSLWCMLFVPTTLAGDWPMPLLLTNIDAQREGAFLNWSPGGEWFEQQQTEGQQCWSQMPVISPIFPHQNVAKRIDPSSAERIQNEFINESMQFSPTKPLLFTGSTNT